MPRARNLASCAETLEQGTQGTQGTQDTHCITQGTPRAHKGHRQTRHTGHQKSRGHLAQGTLCLRLQIWQVVARLFFSTAGHCFYLRSSGSIGAQSGSYLIQGILHSVQGTCTQAGNCLCLCFDMLYLDNLSES